MEYDYFQLRLGRERTAQKALADRLYAMPDVTAVFAPLLGFASNEALVLARAGAELGFVSHSVDRLTPTLRPTQDVAPEPGGIYVHNWFTIDGDAVDEFVRLSGEAWLDFERRFETTIYGLFLAGERGRPGRGRTPPAADDPVPGPWRVAGLTGSDLRRHAGLHAPKGADAGLAGAGLHGHAERLRSSR